MDKKVSKKLMEAIGLLEDVVTLLEGEETAPAKAEKKTGKKAEKEANDDVIVVINEEEYNLTEMSVKEIKKVAKDELDIEFDSSKKDVIIADLIEYLESEEVEVESEDDGDLNYTEMSKKELKELCDERGIEYSKKATEEELIELLEAGEEEEIEIEPEDEENVAEKYNLNELTEAELKEICEQAELSTKGKKQALIDRIVEAVESGELSLEEEEVSYEDMSLEELQEECDLRGIPVPRKDMKNKEKLITLLEEHDEEHDDEVEIDPEEDEDRDPEIVAAEDEVEADIRNDYKKGKLKITVIKETLKQYYDGDADCSDCSKCSKDEMLGCYIKIMRSLVDDDAVAHDMEDPYTRNGEDYCCGRMLDAIDEDTMVCSVCGNEYGEE